MSFLPRLSRSIIAVGGGSALYFGATSPTSASFSFTERSSSSNADPSDCEEVACSDKKNLLFSSFQKTQGKQKQTPLECPLNRAQLGKSTWDLLHTTAAYYPEKPTEAEKQAARDLVNGIAILYPCTHCRAHFAKEVEEDPPDVASRDDFSKWLCERHNNVNKWLEKPQFDCSAESLQVRWRRGKKECYVAEDDDTETAESSLGQER